MSQTVVDPYRLAPPGARLAPAHWLCRLQRHRSLSWADDADLDVRVLTGAVVLAECAGCGRHQPRVRVLYPRDRTISMLAPIRRTSEATEPTDDLDGTGTELVLDVAAERIEESSTLLTDRLLPVDILSHPRLEAAVLGLGRSWLCVKARLDHARPAGERLEGAGDSRAQRRPSMQADAPDGER